MNKHNTEKNIPPKIRKAINELIVKIHTDEFRKKVRDRIMKENERFENEERERRLALETERINWYRYY